MRFPRVGPGPAGSFPPAMALLGMLYWCTSITIATTVIRPSRIVINKRGSDSAPVFIEDQCASFKSDLGDELKRLLNLSWMESSKDIELCLCNSTIANFVSTSGIKQIEIAKAYVGPEKVGKALQTLISRHSPQDCGPLPSHAKRVCNSHGRRSSLCDFSCKSPFRKSNGQCVLPPSPSARPRKRSLEEEIVLMHTSTCLPHEQVCARNGHGFTHPRSSSSRSSSLKGGGSSSQFECIDVTKDLFNCGGCAAGSIGLENEVVGIDCSDLPGADDVECVAGRCIITRCGWGWKVNSNGDGCVRLRK